MAQAMHAESPVHSALPFSGERVGQLFDKIVMDRDWLLAVAQDEQGLIGMLVLFVVPVFYSEALEAGDLAFYVVPDRRGTRAAVQLLHFGEMWASARASVMRLGLTTGVRTDQSARFLEKAGYHCSGILMSKHAR